MIIGILAFSISLNDSNAAYVANKEITKDTEISSGVFGSDIADKNAILINGKINVKLNGIKVNKTGDSSGGD